MLQLLRTKDNSFTLFNPELNETYHSRHGALQESLYVFIKQGLHYCIEKTQNTPLNILEVGFGTGLNAVLTYLEFEKQPLPIKYYSLEPFPISVELTTQLGYTELLQLTEKQEKIFYELHSGKANNSINDVSFTFNLIQSGLMNFNIKTNFNLIYFDAFAPEKQPDLWTKEVFEKCYFLLDNYGVLVTYCAKGEVKRTLKASGFKVETLPGPPGKREMIRAIKEPH